MIEYKNIIIIVAMKFELDIFCKNLLKHNFINIKIELLSHDLKRILYVFKNDKTFIQIIIFFSGIGEKFLDLKTIFNFLEKNLDLNNEKQIFNVNLVYLVGLSGSCNDKYKVGTTLKVGTLKYKEESITLDKEHNVTLMTSDNIVKYEDKKHLSETNIDIVDMETFFWVKELKNFIDIKNIKVFRAISDDLSFIFPESLDDTEFSRKIFKIINSDKNLILKKIFLSSLFKKVNSNIVKFFVEIKRILSMRKNFHLARKNLTKTLLKEILGK